MQCERVRVRLYLQGIRQSNAPVLRFQFVIL